MPNRPSNAESDDQGWIEKQAWYDALDLARDLQRERDEAVALLREALPCLQMPAPRPKNYSQATRGRIEVFLMSL